MLASNKKQDFKSLNHSFQTTGMDKEEFSNLFKKNRNSGNQGGQIKRTSINVARSPETTGRKILPDYKSHKKASISNSQYSYDNKNHLDIFHNAHLTERDRRTDNSKVFSKFSKSHASNLNENEQKRPKKKFNRNLKRMLASKFSMGNEKPFSKRDRSYTKKDNFNKSVSNTGDIS
jgi:hypothetical protein